MIVTNHFVFIHVSRHAGTFLNKLILENIPGAVMLRYHGHLCDLPAEYHELPVIGFVRNPWDWYVSMYHDYHRKQQYIFQIISDMGTLDFSETVRKYLLLGQESDESNRLKQSIIQYAPDSITIPTSENRQMPGLVKSDFSCYTQDRGYYSWLFVLMYDTDRGQQIHIGRFESLRDEMHRLLELTGVEMTPAIDNYLKHQQATNPSPRDSSYREYYNNQLRNLVAEKDRAIIEKYGYTF